MITKIFLKLINKNIIKEFQLVEMSIYINYTSLLLISMGELVENISYLC